MRWICLTLVLAGCAGERSGCERAVLREFRTVNALVEETETNLARGYTYEYEESPFRGGLTLCTGSYNARFCTSNYGGVRRRAVAIDPETERRKLAQLEARRDALATGGAELCRPAT